MVAHNNVLPNAHFHKGWERYVKTWFDQPGRKQSRRIARIRKAARVAPRPMDALRPAVRCPTLKYNTKVRAGRGFTLEELKEAGVRRKEARALGIAVDHRRKNRSVEGMKVNVLRLQAYKEKLIVIPKKVCACICAKRSFAFSMAEPWPCIAKRCHQFHRVAMILAFAKQSIAFS
jgi:large subunit ribosomal protein L13e